MSRGIRFRPSSRGEIARRAREESRRSQEETRRSIDMAVSQLGRYTFQNEQTFPQELTPRAQEPVYEIGATLPPDHPLVEARERREQGRPRRNNTPTERMFATGFLPGQMTEMYGYTGYGRSIHGRRLPSMNEGERVEREQPAYLRFDADGVTVRDTQSATFYNPKFYEVDPDNVKNTMDMIKVFRAMLGKITLDEETVKKYGLEAYVKEK